MVEHKGELERQREAVSIAVDALAELSSLGGTSSIGNNIAARALGKVRSILNPPPVFEEETRVVWQSINTPGLIHFQPPCEEMEKFWVKLTGSYQRPIPPKKVITKKGQFQLDGNFREFGVPSNSHYGKEITITWEE